MPKNLAERYRSQSFADMWATLRQERAWSALVKNRRKNGDPSWARANPPLAPESLARFDEIGRLQPEIQQAGPTSWPCWRMCRCVRPRCLRPAAGSVAQVNVAVSQLDQMTQQNAAMVDQIAAAARGLQPEALRLREAIDAFA